ncbi:MAG: bifunctional 3-deoxy-7-phosphoheptulonate synthase/chorismate mutase [Bacteroidetes bacterium]|jgi:3-deoxy-7-phosphoheptulonate synthase|nr:bifunctional 3-deoxy-7-phosphoheptulonate synthase/chorismate mutase [Bacteroidota bacterium]MBT5530640.1 bifunctional 3-deoxy-7-phosphoheptulonate synthase/chorismate mutase [Cytophagia bacterium]MBT3800571.1 bifunctional 3-deoxy-7-phosphoheptulonate synthase/chorismate mutase [Bacteroidota bacterium]MBT4337302.1 bifunctional 3-deoxy-7-phosphoheptulonate synthase/chorismate mutase [Bacteroidota bacterium]MBT4730309.1 bifunctional 3-deoxy-7-phosphoheptulonate synthase/chorismate mutase [Bact
MIIHLKQGIQQVAQIAEELQAIVINDQDKTILVNSSSVKELPSKFDDLVDEVFVFSSDIQLADIAYTTGKRSVQIGENQIGGNTGNTLMVAGPCSVESIEQVEQTAELLNELNLSCLRAGSYKPRTSPYSFQGMGEDGLKILRKVCDDNKFSLFSEVRDATHVNEIIEYSDVVQIGAKAMYSQGILRACAKTQKPVLLKRGFGTTIQEFVQAAEFILSGGNMNVILCERGIRTFETKTRFTLDLCGVAHLKEYTNLPIILDPSHAIGYAYGVPDLARACFAMGIDGLLIEVHPNPKVAKSDASQQLNHNEFKDLYNSLKPLASALNRKLI